jgi:hypothetical protein
MRSSAGLAPRLESPELTTATPSGRLNSSKICGLTSKLGSLLALRAAATPRTFPEPLPLEVKTVLE